MQTSVPEIAIVGGGCSGALAALHLLQSQRPVRVHLIEPSPHPGFGLAYSTDCPLHLLNVPAHCMSVLPDHPGDFMEWLAADTVAPDSHAFLPREIFGRYVAERLETARRQAHPRSALIHHRARALNLRREGKIVVLDLSDGVKLHAGSVVLALGNAAPRRLPYFPPAGTNPMFHDSAWAPGALEVSDPESPVALIGSGLTAVDAFAGLRANGHWGVVHMISGRGILPQPHRAPGASPVKNGSAGVQWKARSLRELVRHVRRQIRSTEERGGDWRDVIASLRGLTNELWSGFTRRDQERFYRHVKNYWDVHRHRMAPRVAAMIDAARRDGTLRVHAGRVVRVARMGDALQIEIRRPSQTTLRMPAQRLINCTGPEQDYRRVDNCLLQSLFAKGCLEANPLGIGIRTAENGAVIDRQDVAMPWLYAIGPMRIGGLLETTAVPEIREQAAAIARTLLSQSEGARSAVAVPLGQISREARPAAAP